MYESSNKSHTSTTIWVVTIISYISFIFHWRALPDVPPNLAYEPCSPPFYFPFLAPVPVHAPVVELKHEPSTVKEV